MVSNDSEKPKTKSPIGYEPRESSLLTPRERELMHGMVNCCHVCHANFEETTEMVGLACGLSSQEVKEILKRLRREDGDEYKELREKLPDEFPL